jgi:hypothetical protein
MLRGRGEPEERIRSMYGVEGVNFAVAPVGAPGSPFKEWRSYGVIEARFLIRKSWSVY